MEGKMFVKGNLYLTEDMIPSLLKKTGIEVHVRKDVIFLSQKENIKLEADDVFIEDLLRKLDVKDVIAFSILAN